MKLKKNLVFLLALIVFGIFFPMSAAAQNQTIRIQSLDQVENIQEESPIEDEIIVIYRETKSIENLALTTKEVKAGETLNEWVDIIQVADSADTEEVVERLSRNDNVLVAEKNRKLQTSGVPNDPLLQAAWQFEGIGADKTWNKVNNEEMVVVAMIDTGLNVDHPDIKDNVVSGYDFVDNTPQMKDISGHGTLAAGCLAAVANNNVGIAGVVGNANIKIAPYRVGGRSRGDKDLDLAYICAALYEAADRPEVRVINMSFGGYIVSNALQIAVDNAERAGKVLVSAAGNEANSSSYAGQSAIPASYHNVISVGSIDRDNKIANFSQYNESVDLCAPGDKIYSTNQSGGYEVISGTSFSVPLVSGACAVLLAARPEMTGAEAVKILKDTALDLGATGRDNYYGHGAIQLDAALYQINPSALVMIDNFSIDKPTGQSPGTTINLFASATGGEGSCRYKFYYELGGVRTDIQDYDSNKYVSFVPERTGVYSLFVEAQDDVGNSAKKSVKHYVITDQGGASTRYRTHVQNLGWQTYVTNGDDSGTEGQSLRLEGIEINADSDYRDLSVKYKTHVENIGWQSDVLNGAMSGTNGRSLRLESIRIELTGRDAEFFDIYYQTHTQNIGWMGWAKNGEASGSAGYGYRLEGIRIVILPKGSVEPGRTENAFVELN